MSTTGWVASGIAALRCSSRLSDHVCMADRQFMGVEGGRVRIAPQLMTYPDSLGGDLAALDARAALGRLGQRSN
jgi:hypothetical protein